MRHGAEADFVADGPPRCWERSQRRADHAFCVAGSWESADQTASRQTASPCVSTAVAFPAAAAMAACHGAGRKRAVKAPCGWGRRRVQAEGRARTARGAAR
eukprot:365285-Chlamydomonas_euryale.AAC.7